MASLFLCRWTHQTYQTPLETPHIEYTEYDNFYSKNKGEVYSYVGDDGLIYCS